MSELNQNTGIRIDRARREIIVEEASGERRLPFASAEAFEIVSEVWIQAGWDVKYPYTFSWLGRPIIQNPEDLVRVQEVVFALKPDVVLETGIAHGGSLIFYAGLLKAMGNGRVIGVDVEIRPHNLTAIESHELFPMITMIEGSSTAPEIVESVRARIRPGERVFLVLDSKHTRDHVRAELEAYCGLVGEGSAILVEDGIMRDVVGAPRTDVDWSVNNPIVAIDDFLESHPEFERFEPIWSFNESVGLSKNITYFRDGWLRRTPSASVPTK